MREGGWEMGSRRVAVAVVTGALASIGAGGQAMAAGRLLLVRDDEPAPPGTHVVARIGFTDAEQPGLGSCVQIATGTLATNERAADQADLTESKCFEGVGMSVSGLPTRIVLRSTGIASAVSATGFTITEPGPCTYKVKKVFGSFSPFGGTAEFTFATLAKLAKGASFHCTVGREIIGEAVLNAHVGESEESEVVGLQTFIVG